MSFDREWHVHRYKSLTSTMDRASLLAQFGARERTAVVSDEQSAGRGRAGRTWQSPLNAAIYCTLIVRPDVAPDRLPVLSLVTGVAVAETIERFTNIHVQLKWPNDVWLGDDPDHQKVAGILLTSKLSGSNVDFVLIGIGINVSVPLEELPAGATSLSVASSARPSTDVVFGTLLTHFDAAYTSYLDTKGHVSLAGWHSRAALLNEPVMVEDGGRVHEGIFRGVDDDCALLLQEASGTLLHVFAGDLVRGPKAIQFR